MQLMPLQYLNIVFLEIEAARQHARDVLIALNPLRLTQ